MKKILLFSLLFLSFYNLFAQNVLKFNAYSISFFDKNTSKWEEEIEPVNMLVSLNFDDGKIKIYSKETQIFDIIEIYKEEKIQRGIKFRFYCEDKSGKNCYVDLVSYDDGEKQLYVRYIDLMYYYSLEFSQ
ncbi:hypothetical protein G6R40_09590 [Chryseobacterium sp. POL2]|uniref:hypothetical protein n=1 Tax=Chryseobacterium sp. POL2 TaxID=2713414 RepID=UPI0013E20425|nr:hypothetical protein [Chryseobacterium sp. POL2]QIG89896.1 hypothetical protein G6R40_09590 [Chryseobacterium sp. POL2]